VRFILYNLWIFVASLGGGIALWHFLFDFLPWLPDVAAMILGAISFVAFYGIYFVKRPCGHSNVAIPKLIVWITPIERRCPVCGDEL